jgi:hypothetical protein
MFVTLALFSLFIYLLLLFTFICLIYFIREGRSRGDVGPIDGTGKQ